MKTLLLLLFIPLIAQSQVKSPVFPIVNDRVVYTGVVQVDSLQTVEHLRDRAKYFLNKAATDNNASVQYDYSKIKDYIVTDNPTNVIGNVRFQASRGIVYVLFEAVLNIEFKQGRYRYTLDNIKEIANNLAGKRNEAAALETTYDISKNTKMLLDFDTRIKKLIAELEKIMKEPAKADF